MKSNGEGLEYPQSFKVGIIDCYYIELDEKVIDYTQKVKRGEKRISTLTGNKIYFMKCNLIEKRAGAGAPKYIQGEFQITKEQYDEKIFERGDVLQIFSGSVFRIENFTLKDKNKKSLELVEKKYHKIMTQNGKQIPYIEKRIANVSIVCKQDQWKLYEKKNLKYYYKIEDLKFNITEAEKSERIYTFYIDGETAQKIQHLHNKNKIRVELWNSVKRIKIHTAQIQCGIYEGNHFFNMTLTTESSEVLKAQREQKKLEREAKQRREEERIKAEQLRLQQEQNDRDRIEREKHEAEEAAERERQRLAEIERQKRLRQLEIENKRQYIIRPDLD